MIDAQIKFRWGYNVGPFPPEVVLSGGGTVIDHWPDANPPTIAEIEAVVLPTPPPVADWAAFRMGLLTSPAYQRIGGHNSSTLALLPMLVSVGFLIDSDASKLLDFAATWNAIAAIAEPSTEEIASLNALAVTHNIPFTLDSEGLL